MSPEFEYRAGGFGARIPATAKDIHRAHDGVDVVFVRGLPFGDTHLVVKLFGDGEPKHVAHPGIMVIRHPQDRCDESRGFTWEHVVQQRADGDLLLVEGGGVGGEVHPIQPAFADKDIEERVFPLCLIEFVVIPVGTLLPCESAPCVIGHPRPMEDNAL